MSDMARQSLGDKAGAALKMSLFYDFVDFSTFATVNTSILPSLFLYIYPDSQKTL